MEGAADFESDCANIPVVSRAFTGVMTISDDSNRLGCQCRTTSAVPQNKSIPTQSHEHMISHISPSHGRNWGILPHMGCGKMDLNKRGATHHLT